MNTASDRILDKIVEAARDADTEAVHGGEGTDERESGWEALGTADALADFIDRENFDGLVSIDVFKYKNDFYEPVLKVTPEYFLEEFGDRNYQTVTHSDFHEHKFKHGSIVIKCYEDRLFVDQES